MKGPPEWEGRWGRHDAGGVERKAGVRHEEPRIDGPLIDDIYPSVRG
jgi:hypothetical protein